MTKFTMKIILLFLLNILCNLSLIYFGMLLTFDTYDLSAFIETIAAIIDDFTHEITVFIGVVGFIEKLVIIFFYQFLVYLTYCIKKIDKKTYKIIYWVLNTLCYAVTYNFWIFLM